MPGYTTSVVNSNAVALNLNTETVIATLPGCGTSAPGRAIRFSAECKLTSGATATAVTLRVRRDGLTGAVVGDQNPVQLEVAAGQTEDHDLTVDDSQAQDIFNRTYVLTAQQTAATGNGSSIYAYFKAQCE